MKMRSNISALGVSRTFLWLLLTGAAAALQLPPEIQADRYLVRAERQIEEQDYVGAKESLEQILALQNQHGLEVPEEFHLHYAEVLARLELHDEAIASAMKYLTLAGRGGEHYRAALELLDKAEQAKAEAVAAAEAARRKAEAARERAAAAEAAAGEARRKAEAVISGMEFVWVPAGEFRMGSKSSEASSDERPRTRVRISQGFYLGKYEVTRAQWQAVVGSIPAQFEECGGPNCPVTSVSWHDVQEFTANLNAREGRQRYRLPTEAEWEHAARAGTTGDRYGNLDAIAWYEDNSANRPHPVGRKAPNAWGLHDMLGNVYEWVADWYVDHLPGGTVTDPQGPVSGKFRVWRGGTWAFDAGDCRTSDRDYHFPGTSNSVTGFRLLRTE